MAPRRLKASAYFSMVFVGAALAVALLLAFEAMIPRNWNSSLHNLSNGLATVGTGALIVGLIVVLWERRYQAELRPQMPLEQTQISLAKRLVWFAQIGRAHV